MKTGFLEGLRCLGTLTTICDGCRREIGVREDRNRCLACQTDLCLQCDACSAHTVVRCPGFKEVTDLSEALMKADAYINEACGWFQGRDDVYITGVRALSDYLIAREIDTGKAARILDAIPGGFRSLVEQHGEAWLRHWVSLRDMGRFVDYFARRTIMGRLPHLTTWLHAQGSHGPISWKGRPMMRTVWDFALSSIMIEEIRPRTIIELGTAAGGSAVWYADLQRMLGLTPSVTTVDLDPPALDHEGVTVLRGDTHAIARVLPHDMMAEWPHPLLLIEDAHENIDGVLEHFDAMLTRGDYVTVEDIDAEQALGAFLLRHPGRYLVDARYTDYFGHNATCCADQILCRMT